MRDQKPWIGCGECDVLFPCCNGKACCIRLAPSAESTPSTGPTAMTPPEARALALKVEVANLMDFPEDHVLAVALRSLADQVEALHTAYGHSQQQFIDAMQQVEALQGQALSSVEREEYFAMKKDAERYRWLRDSGAAVSAWTDDTGTNWSVSTRDWKVVPAQLDEAIDRAREAT